MLRLEFSSLEMLRYLSIRRLAVIDSVDVEFDPGFNVLTGETGAGKSILVGAVGLLLGDRASADLIRTGEDTATVEALFDTDGQELVVRREITAQGRSRAFVNGALTTAAALRDLASNLIELHGQHEHQTLLDPASHLSVLDGFARLERAREGVAACFEELKRSRENVVEYRRVSSDLDARRELMAFQFSELDRANLRPGEDEELQVTRQVLANAERIERLCAEGYALLYEQDDAVLATLGHVWRKVADLAAIDPRFAAHLEARHDVKARLEDLALLLREFAQADRSSPARLQQTEERLALLERLKRKYGPTLSDAISRRASLGQELAGLETFGERTAELQARSDAAERAYREAATALSAARREAAARLVPQVERLLGDLAMERARVEVRFGAPLPMEAWTASGLDQAELFVSPNPGEDLRPLARVASGGELSRIMMAIKTLTAVSRHGFSDALERVPSAATPGLVFDEVDAGIGGRVADVVGRKLRVLGSAFQVLCITHLPQIAAYADTHFAITKHVAGGRTTTAVARLDDGGRVGEISRMLGGEGVSDSILASAREMLADRRRGGVAREAKDKGIAKGESESRRRAATSSATGQPGRRRRAPQPGEGDNR